MAGQIYTLICTGKVVGVTSLNSVVTWSNSNGVVTSDNYTIVSNGNLVFNPLHTSHGGQYTCRSMQISPFSSTAIATTNVIVKSKHLPYCTN